jgi:hypothetical protein
MVIVSAFAPEPPAFAAFMVTVEVAALIGVPEITPLAAFTVSPAGSPVAL